MSSDPEKEPNDAAHDLDSSRWPELYGDYLFRIAMSRIKSREAAEDIVQETMISAHNARDKFEGRSSVKTWLVSILRNKIIDYARKAGREQTVSYDDLGSDTVVEQNFNSFGIWSRWHGEWQGSPEKLVEHQRFLEQLQDCVRHLPDNLRRVLVMKTFDDLSTDEVCRELEITANNLWVILYRARLRLRECLDANWFKEATDR